MQITRMKSKNLAENIYGHFAVHIFIQFENKHPVTTSADCFFWQFERLGSHVDLGTGSKRTIGSVSCVFLRVSNSAISKYLAHNLV